MAELKYVDWDGLVYYDGKIKQYIQDRDENYVKMGGIMSFDKLPDPTYYNLHYIYKITDKFTTNSRFDTPGLVCEAGTWVQCVDLHEDASKYRYIIFNEETIGGTADIDLSDYYTKSEVEAKIDEAIQSIDIPQPELFIIDYNSPNFADAFDAYKAGKLLLLTNAAPDIDSYAIMNYVRSDLITFTKFLMSRSSAYGAFNTYYLHSDNTWEVAKEVRLNKVEAKVDDNNTISELVIGKDTYAFDNFATTENITQLTQDIENIENTYVTNETLQNNYVSNTYITENYTTNEELEATYVTNDKVTEVVTQEVNTVVTEQIETKVTEVIQEKVDAGEITVAADKISYGDFEDDI